MYRTLLPILVFLLSCETPENSEQNFINESLRLSAERGENYTGHRYLIITENNVALTRIDPTTGDTINNVVGRGTVLENHPRLAALDNAIAVRFPDDSMLTWSLERNAPFFHQYSDGMRYPVIGVIDKDNSTMSEYDAFSNKERLIKLKKGRSYYWIIFKDGNLINIIDSLGQNHSGILSEPCSIVQMEDHLKIVSEKTREELIKTWR